MALPKDVIEAMVAATWVYIRRDRFKEGRSGYVKHQDFIVIVCLTLACDVQG